MDRSSASEKISTRFLFFLLVMAALAIAVQAEQGTSKFQPPSPNYGVRVEQSVMIPMRDGVRLATDLYFPVDAGEKLPAIMIRTPYNKDNFFTKQWLGPYIFAGQGYVVAVQDCRGRYASEGEYIVSAYDPQDGYDMVTWLATQAWSNGNVGTYGCSYMGENQIGLAAQRNPHHKAMIPQAAGGEVGSAGGRYRYFGVFNGGAFELSTGFGWFRKQGTKFFYQPPQGTARETRLEISPFFNPAPHIPDIDFSEIWKSLPVIDMMKRAGAPPTDLDDFLSHDLDDPWWDRFGYIKDSDRFDVPALHINAWHDLGVADTLFLYNLFQKNAESGRCRDNQYLIVSPLPHCEAEFFLNAKEQTIVGERDLGDTRFDFWGTYIRWFDYWLKGIESSVREMPKVQIYVMGKNEWRSEKEWPLARTRYTKYYFHSDGYANSRFGTGVLSTKAPGSEPSDRVVYDPKTPVPSLGGPICCTGTPDAVPGSYDQSEIEMRHDLLVYTSEVLKEGLEVTGPIEAVLYVSSSAKDTDFTAKLVDVYPDGTAYNVQEGILRARYREGIDKKVWMKPGEVYELKVSLHATSNSFGPGHRIRVEISSSNFPRFARNLNTGGNNFTEKDWVVAENMIHHNKKYPSHVLLPVVE